jgi:hypothetical protein
VKNRDLTCRFRDCNGPAEHADIDQTVAWPAGPAQPSDLKCLCRIHQLRTLWTGTAGWSDHQDPDSTITWTAPTGHTTNPTREHVDRNKAPPST